MKWQFVFDGGRANVSKRREDARATAYEWGYQFYLWVDELFSVDSNMLVRGIGRADLF